MSSSAFSQYVMSLDDLYEMAQRNGYFLPKRSSSAINELMLYNPQNPITVISIS